MGFFKKGMEGIKENDKFEAAQKARAEQLKNTPRDFYLALGQKATIMVLDSPDDFFFIKRHAQWINQKANNITCMEEENDCPACQAGNIAQLYLVCTVLTMDAYKNPKTQKEYKYQKQLLVLKGDSKKFLLDLLKDKKTLKNCVIEVSRGSQAKSISIGNYNFKGKLPKEKFDKLVQILPKFIKSNTEQDIPVSKYLAPYDYEKVFAPLPKEQIAKMFGMVSVESYGGSDDDFKCTDDLDISDNDTTDDLDVSDDLEGSLDTTDIDEEVPFEGATLKKDAGSDYVEHCKNDQTSEYESLDDDELLEKMVEMGCRKGVAQKMKRTARIEWIDDTIAEMKAEAGEQDREPDEQSIDGLDEMSEKELTKILKEEFSIPSKKILAMEQDEMVAAIREMRAED